MAWHVSVKLESVNSFGEILSSSFKMPETLSHVQINVRKIHHINYTR